LTQFPYGITTYCDDIRMEVAGKVTLVGCYTGEMTIFGVTPAALPVFCAFVNFQIPTTMTFEKTKVVLTVDYGSEVTELAQVEFAGPEENDEEKAKRAADGQFLSVNIPIRLTPLVIQKEVFIRCRAYVDGSEFKLGSLKVVISDPAAIDPTLVPLTPATSAPHTPRP
jgi:hypothetical protein